MLLGCGCGPWLRADHEFRAPSTPPCSTHQRTNLIFEASKEQEVWWQQMISKGDAEKLVLTNPIGSFVVRQVGQLRLFSLFFLYF